MVINFLLFSAAFLVFAYTVFRVIFKRDYSKRQRLSPVSTMLGVLVFAIHGSSMYLALPTKWPYLPRFPENQALVIVSIVIFCIGILVLFTSWFGLGTKISLGADKNKLKTGGLYKYSRNPQLVGYMIILASFTIMYFSYVVLIWFSIYLITAYLMVKSEEEFLERKYKEEYRDYCMQVPRIIKI